MMGLLDLLRRNNIWELQHKMNVSTKKVDGRNKGWILTFKMHKNNLSPKTDKFKILSSKFKNNNFLDVS